MTQRDAIFYSELKQTNNDLLEYLKEVNSKSHYFDFTPTLEDYIDQVMKLTKKYPPLNTNAIDSTSAPPPPTTTFSLGGNAPAFSIPTAPATTTSSSAFSSTFTSSSAFSSTFSAPSTTATATTTTTAPATNATAAAPIFASPTSSIFSTVANFSSVPTSVAFPSAQPFSLGGTNSSVFSSTTSTPFTFTMPKKDDAPAAQPDQSDNNNDNDDAPPPEPKIDKYEEPNAKHSAKCKLYERGKSVGGEVAVNLLGIGYLYVKDMDTPNKLQVIFRQEPDLRRVLLNEAVSPSIPVKMLPKAVQLVFPSENGEENRFIIAKLKDDNEAKALYDVLNLAQNKPMF